MSIGADGAICSGILSAAMRCRRAPGGRGGGARFLFQHSSISKVRLPMSCPVPSRSSTRRFRRVTGTVGAFSIVVTSAVIGLVAVADGVAEAAATVDST